MSGTMMFILFSFMLPFILFLVFLFTGVTDRKGETAAQKKKRQAETAELATGCSTLLVIGGILVFLVIVVSILLA